MKNNLDILLKVMKRYSERADHCFTVGLVISFLLLILPSFYRLIALAIWFVVTLFGIYFMAKSKSYGKLFDRIMSAEEKAYKK